MLEELNKQIKKMNDLVASGKSSEALVEQQHLNRLLDDLDKELKEHDERESKLEANLRLCRSNLDLERQLHRESDSKRCWFCRLRK